VDKTPFELRILGSTELAGRLTGSGDGLVRQTKRLALLAYLALETAAGYRRRDEIIGLFWPELDQGQGRTYLRKSLHAIRGELDDGVVVSRGDEEIRVDQSVLWCDAVALREYHKAQRHREALDLYRGELLAGLFPEGVAQEFEEWLRQERKALRRTAARCAWECARIDENHGDTGAAAAMARRALEIEPDDEEGVRRLMSLLDKRGDRGGALRVYAEWQSRLKSEYGVEPAPETRKLARKVQATRKGESHETPPALLPVDRQSVVAAQPVHEEDGTAALSSDSSVRQTVGWRKRVPVIVVGLVSMTAIALGPRFITGFGIDDARSVTVLPFRIIGDSALRSSAEVFEEEITTALAQDSTLIVRPAFRPAPHDAGAADETAADVGTAYLLHGSVQRSVTRIRVTLRLVRTADGTAVWAGSHDFDEADRAPLAQRLSQKAAGEISWTLNER
jgi:DNA-binding SARP family transcriptional activator/TolB-like protein